LAALDVFWVIILKIYRLMMQIIFLIEKYLKLQNQKLVNVYFPKIILNGFYVSNFILKKNNFC